MGPARRCSKRVRGARATNGTKEARDQREREALHERSIYRRRKSRPQVEGTEEDCVHKIRDPKRVPHQERLAETKLIITGHACGNPKGAVTAMAMSPRKATAKAKGQRRLILAADERAAGSQPKCCAKPY